MLLPVRKVLGKFHSLPLVLIIDENFSLFPRRMTSSFSIVQSYWDLLMRMEKVEISGNFGDFGIKSPDAFVYHRHLVHLKPPY